MRFDDGVLQPGKTNAQPASVKTIGLMGRGCIPRQCLSAFLIGTLLTLSGDPLCAQDWKQDHFRWMHGANYVASYAATDVEMWLNYVTEGQTIRQEDFPPGVLCGHYSPEGRIWRGRGQRCFEVMPKMRDVTLEQARRFALETYAPAGPIWVKPLCAAYDKYHHIAPDPDLSMKMLAAAVRDWDHHVCEESVGATAFRYWRIEYGKFHPEAFGHNEAYGAPRTEEEQRNAVRALGAAADYLKSKFGSPLVPWGQLLRLRRGALDLPLDGDVGFFGGLECMRATGTQNPENDGRYVFNGGQVIPTVVELTDPIQAWSIVPYGQSRRPESRHYADQARLYSAGRMRPAWHTWNQLRDHVGSTRVIEYRPKTRDAEPDIPNK